jgi:hypothetical protein
MSKTVDVVFPLVLTGSRQGASSHEERKFKKSQVKSPPAAIASGTAMLSAVTTARRGVRGALSALFPLKRS